MTFSDTTFQHLQYVCIYYYNTFVLKYQIQNTQKPIQTLWKSNTSKSAIIPVKSRGFSFLSKSIYSNTLASVSRGKPLRCALPFRFAGRSAPAAPGQEQAPCTFLVEGLRPLPSAFTHARRWQEERASLSSVAIAYGTGDATRGKGLAPCALLILGALPPCGTARTPSAASWLLRSFPEKLR